MRLSLTSGGSRVLNTARPEAALPWSVLWCSSPVPCNSMPWPLLPVTTVRSACTRAHLPTYSPLRPHSLSRLPASVAWPQLT